MKTPIEGTDIRKGDLVRKEFTAPDSFRVAIEYRASGDAHCIGGIGPHFLLDRPTPPVELPTETCLGWVTSQERGRELAEWNVGETDEWAIPVLVEDVAPCIERREVTAFTEAVAVPKAALDRLRAIHASPDYDTRAMARAAAKFLHAADEANA